MQGDRNPLDVAWAAGLFEGEGCWNASHSPPAYGRPKGRVLIQARLGMTDRDVVERFAAIMRFGSVRHHHSPAHRAKGHKPMTEWYTAGADRVREMVALFEPYMGERRLAKAREVLAAGAHIGPANGKQTECPAGHSLSGDNLIIETYKRANKDGVEREFTARRCRKCRREQSRERARKRLGITPDRYRITGND